MIKKIMKKREKISVKKGRRVLFVVI